MSKDNRHVFSGEAVGVVQVVDDEQLAGSNLGGDPADRGPGHAVLPAEALGTTLRKPRKISSHRIPVSGRFGMLRLDDRNLRQNKNLRFIIKHLGSNRGTPMCEAGNFFSLAWFG